MSKKVSPRKENKENQNTLSAQEPADLLDQFLQKMVDSLQELRSEIVKIKETQAIQAKHLHKIEWRIYEVQVEKQNEKMEANLPKILVPHPDDTRPVLRAVCGVWWIVTMSEDGRDYNRRDHPEKFTKSEYPDLKFSIDGDSLCWWVQGEFTRCRIDQPLFKCRKVVLNEQLNRLQLYKYQSPTVEQSVENIYIKDGRLCRIIDDANGRRVIIYQRM